MCDVTICDVTLLISYYMYVYDERKVKSDVSDYHIKHVQLLLPYPIKSIIMTYISPDTFEQSQMYVRVLSLVHTYTFLKPDVNNNNNNNNNRK